MILDTSGSAKISDPGGSDVGQDYEVREAEKQGLFIAIQAEGHKGNSLFLFALLLANTIYNV
jgi:hypothetical protein